jgi:Uma2 family endonuclease
MSALKESFTKLTPDEYFAWEEGQNNRHEYIDGDVYVMSGGTINHSEIAGNFLAIVKAHLRGSGCKTLNSDARVSIQGSSHYVYPDLSVTCDARDQVSSQFITYPCLIVEVLSPTTEAYDRGQKFRRYRRNASLQDYVLVDADSIMIELYHKGSDGKWDIIDYREGDIVELKSVNLTFPIELVYEDIIFETE